MGEVTLLNNKGDWLCKAVAAVAGAVLIEKLSCVGAVCGNER